MELLTAVDSHAHDIRVLEDLPCLSLAVVIHDQSSSHVIQYRNGHWACTCDGFQSDMNCPHIVLARGHLYQQRVVPTSGFSCPGVGMTEVPIQAIAARAFTTQTVGVTASRAPPWPADPSPYVVRNLAFQRQFALYHDRVFAGLVDEQCPHTIWVSCSDSRVIPEVVVQAPPGHLFVLRNVGNIIPPPGSEASAVGAALTYALSHLPSVRNIVVCGHYGCGAMHALGDRNPESTDGQLAKWLTLAEPVLEMINLSPEHEDFEQALVEANVIYQIKQRLCQYPVVRKRLAERAITIHGLVYDLTTGALSELLRVASLADIEHLELRPAA